MKLERTKSAESPIRGCCMAQQVHLLSQLRRVLELMGTHSLPTPQASVNRGPRPNHRQVTEAPCLCKCKVTGRQQHWGFYRYFVGVSARQQSHPYGRSVSNSSSMSLSARTAGGHSLEERRQ